MGRVLLVSNKKFKELQKPRTYREVVCAKLAQRTLCCCRCLEWMVLGVLLDDHWKPVLLICGMIVLGREFPVLRLPTYLLLIGRDVPDCVSLLRKHAEIKSAQFTHILTFICVDNQHDANRPASL